MVKGFQQVDRLTKRGHNIGQTRAKKEKETQRDTEKKGRERLRRCQKEQCVQDREECARVKSIVHNHAKDAPLHANRRLHQHSFLAAAHRLPVLETFLCSPASQRSYSRGLIQPPFRGQ